jgi:hypothetical protein
METPWLRLAFGALRRFSAALWPCDLARSPPALERRRIAHPKGLGLRRFSKSITSGICGQRNGVSMINLRSLSALGIGRSLFRARWLFRRRLGVWRLVDAHAVDNFHDHRDLLSSLRNTSPTDREIFLKKVFLEKGDAHVHQLRRKSRQVPLPDKGMGAGGPPLGARQNAHHLRGWPRPFSATRP